MIARKTPQETMPDTMSLYVRQDPRKGRCVATSGDIKAGTIVHMSLPYACVPDAEQYESGLRSSQSRSSRATNASSLSRTSASRATYKDAPRQHVKLNISCKGRCERTFYCSTDCRDADAGQHTLVCKSIKDLIKIEEQYSTHVDPAVEEYGRLLIMVLARHFQEVSGALDAPSTNVEAVSSIVDDGQPIPKISATYSFSDMWKLVSNASSYSEDRVRNEFLPVALALTRAVAVHIFPFLPPSILALYSTPEKLLPESQDERMIQLAEEAVMTLDTCISSDPLLTSLFEVQPVLPMKVLSASSVSILPKMSQVSVIRLLASNLSLICKEECNSFGHYAFTFKGPTFPRQGYAIAVHPSAVFFNHSCAPNVSHLPRTSAFPGIGIMSFYAVTDIAAGQELCLSYVGMEGTHNYENPREGREEPTPATASDGSIASGVVDTITCNARHERALRRRRALKRVFQFDCDCARCLVDLVHGVEDGCGDEEEKQRVRELHDGASLDLSRVEEVVEDAVARYVCSRDGCLGYFAPAKLLIGDMEEREDLEGLSLCVACHRVVSF
ncbi:hypothetical protein BC830DRAFT_44769 [Chytriomyces sp. MP71]|nr:hypothetical protein BC830DRAFT_44769 [Chytriomyces sp. MP71]